MQNLLKISLKEIISDSRNTENIIFNFFSYKYTNKEKSRLFKGLNFSLKPGSTKSSEFLLPFEVLFYDRERKNTFNPFLPNVPF